MGEIEALRIALINESDSGKRFELICRAISFLTSGVDVSVLFPEIVKSLATENLVQKKLVYFYLRTFASKNPDLTLLVVNTLQKDCRNQHAYIRRLALRYLASFQNVQVLEYLLPHLEHALLREISPYVKQTALIGSCKLFHFSKQHFQGFFFSFSVSFFISK